MLFTPPLAQLIDALKRLPGIGPRSAQRLAFYMLQQPDGAIFQLAETIRQAKTLVHPCPICFFLTSVSPCELCQNETRAVHQLAVVATTEEVVALERTQSFRGQYHVLQGLISPMDGIGPDQLTIPPLMSRIAVLLETLAAHVSSDDPLSHAPLEVILALPPTIEGDTTSLYLAKRLQALNTAEAVNAPKLLVSRIAFGLPVGGDLDYADSLTIARAIEGRQVLASGISMGAPQ